MKLFALFAAAVLAKNNRRSELEKINDLLDATVDKLEDVQNVIVEKVKPDLEHYQITGQDLRDSLEAQDWDQIESWNDVKDIDWDLLNFRAQALDKHDLVDWDLVQEYREKAFEHIDKKVEQAEYREEKINEIRDTLSNDIDTDLMHQNLHSLQEEDVVVDVDAVKQQLHDSVDELANFDWEDIKGEDDLNWDFIASQIDKLVEEVNKNTETLRDSITEEVKTPELVPQN